MEAGCVTQLTNNNHSCHLNHQMANSSTIMPQVPIQSLYVAISSHMCELWLKSHKYKPLPAVNDNGTWMCFIIQTHFATKRYNWPSMVGNSMVRPSGVVEVF